MLPLPRLLSPNQAAQSFSETPRGWKMPLGQDTVGTRDFIFCPQCKTRQIIAPPDFSAFVLLRPNAANSAVFIRNGYFQDVNRGGQARENTFLIYETRAIGSRLAMFYQEAKGDYPGKELLLNDLAHIIAALLLKCVAKPLLLPKNGSGVRGIEPAIEYMNKNFHQKITLKDLALKAHYSQYHFIRIFQKETGKAPFEYLRDIRVRKAQELLSTTNKTITEIYLQCGFQNSSHFANFFKTQVGMSPSEYRHNLSSR